MNEEQLRAGHAREKFDVAEDGFIGGTVFEGDENMLIHIKP